jgi:putative transcriptional regulator
MALVQFEFDPANPPALSAEAMARLKALDALTEADINARAKTDPDNLPMTRRELARLSAAAAVRDARTAAGMTQADFARAFGFSLGRLRDLEQGRTRPDGAMLNYLRLIRRDPTGVQRSIAD